MWHKCYACGEVSVFQMSGTSEEVRTVATTGRWTQLRERVLDSPESKERYARKKQAVVQTREILMQIDAARERLGLSKAELARRIGSDPSGVRRLFSSKTSNPTLRIILDIVAVLNLDLQLKSIQTGGPPPPSSEKPQDSAQKAKAVAASCPPNRGTSRCSGGT